MVDSKVGIKKRLKENSSPSTATHFVSEPIMSKSKYLHILRCQFGTLRQVITIVITCPCYLCKSNDSSLCHGHFSGYFLLPEAYGTIPCFLEDCCIHVLLLKCPSAHPAILAFHPSVLREH